MWQAMTRDTLSAKRDIFSGEKTAREPQIPHNALLVRLRILRMLLFTVTVPVTFPF